MDENFFIEKIKNKLSQKISPLISEKILNIKFFPIFVSKNFFKPAKNEIIDLINDNYKNAA